MIEGINQNHVTHPYIIANISTNILSLDVFVASSKEERIFSSYSLISQRNELGTPSHQHPWASSGCLHPLQVLRFWLCLSPLTLSPPSGLCTSSLLQDCLSSSLILTWCLLIPWKAPYTYTSLPINNSLHTRYQDNWYSFLHVMLSPQLVCFSSVYL